MTEIKKLKNEFSKFNKNSDYFISDNGQGKITHTIYSEELKQYLREIIHAKASEEWQIKHVLGENFIEYGIEQNNEFGLYRKSLAASSPDEFLITLEGQSSLEREEFVNADRDCEKSWRKIEAERKQIEMIRQKIDQENKGLESNVLGENYISITLQRDKEDKRLINIEEHYNDLDKAQEIREGWGYNFTKQMLSEWMGKRKSDNKITHKQIKTENLPSLDKKVQKEENQALSKDKNNDFSLTTKIVIGSGIILIPVVLVGIVRKWK